MEYIVDKNWFEKKQYLDKNETLVVIILGYNVQKA